MSKQIKIEGLSQSEVEAQISAGKINTDASIKSRSIKQIFYENIFTLFNAVNVILAIIVACTGSFKNMLFMGVIVCNVAIGIIQEIRSKKTTDKLTIVAASKVKVIRDAKVSEIAVDQIVLNDVIVLGRGDQVPADSEVIDGKADINESLLTGESDLVKKNTGDILMSGSFVNSGKVYAKVIHVGAENYATKITAEAKAHKKINSEIMDTMNGLIKFVSCIIFPLGAILFAKSYFLIGNELVTAILTTVSAMIGMIPEGLILLTSTVLAVSVVRLAKSKVLVQQLYCIETLARVDTLCLDKTGTITSGKMIVDKVVAIGDTDEGSVNKIFAALVSADEDKNETSLAIQNYYKNNEFVSENLVQVSRSIPFSSDKKWSGGILDSSAQLKVDSSVSGAKQAKAFVMGATQFILDSDDLKNSDVIKQAQNLSQDSRVLLLAGVDGFDDDDNYVGTPVPMAFICIQDEIRTSAPETIQYFAQQGVDLKVISGDDPRTVSGIAQKVGIVGAQNYCDATTLKTQEDIETAIEKFSVFGRVKPEQKKAFVIALQKHGHTVAMTGDGVNDTLALKQSDCSVAMAAGSSAARNVAQLVLLENDFKAMTHVVAEGRRSINNLQRSASLFLTKTLLSMGLAALFLILPFSYPFQPIQMTLISAFTIGLPSFVLALEPNKDRIKGKFLVNVIVKSIPSAVMAIISVVVINAVGYGAMSMSYEEISTLSVLITSLIGVLLICKLSWPFTPIRIILIIVVVVGTILGATILGDLFNMASFTFDMIYLFGFVSIGAVAGYLLLYRIIDNWYKKRQSELV